jgi:hypothetical protein
MNSHLRALLLGCAFLAAAAAPARSGEISTEPSNCTQPHCDGVKLTALITPLNGFDVDDSSPGVWTGSFYGSRNECLVVSISAEGGTADRGSLTVISPTGEEVYWRPCGSTCNAAVRIRTTARGLYTVQVSFLTFDSFTGYLYPASVLLHYGRYNLDNPKCANPSRPR